MGWLCQAVWLLVPEQEEERRSWLRKRESVAKFLVASQNPEEKGKERAGDKSRQQKPGALTCKCPVIVRNLYLGIVT